MSLANHIEMNAWNHETLSCLIPHAKAEHWPVLKGQSTSNNYTPPTHQKGSQPFSKSTTNNNWQYAALRAPDLTPLDWNILLGDSHATHLDFGLRLGLKDILKTSSLAPSQAFAYHRLHFFSRREAPQPSARRRNAPRSTWGHPSGRGKLQRRGRAALVSPVGLGNNQRWFDCQLVEERGLWCKEL